MNLVAHYMVSTVLVEIHKEDDGRYRYSMRGPKVKITTFPFTVSIHEAITTSLARVREIHPRAKVIDIPLPRLNPSRVVYYANPSQQWLNAHVPSIAQ